MPVAQAQVTQTQAVTQQQSQVAVETLLRTGLSCIAFLRNLLPEENFTRSNLTSSEDSFGASSEADTPGGVRGRVNKFQVMTLVRGYTDEADRILNYLENGIFDALSKQYLRSFIFAIYLDSKDPTNIVEAYTFNFKYHKLPGTDVVAPIMTLGDDLEKMSLGGASRLKRDPVAEAVQKGRLPTLREVKKSVKTMVKTLIQCVTTMEELPRRRFATFKLFYTDSTPPDYEPPNFKAGDVDKDKWFLMTHNLDEVPDRFSIGKLNSGFHTVDLKVASVVAHLPSPSGQEDAVFTGTVNKGAAGAVPSNSHDAATFIKQTEAQEEDARVRNLVWSAEADLDLTDIDAEGELDPGDLVQGPDGVYVSCSELKAEAPKPIGLRNEKGEIEPVALALNETLEAHFQGLQEPVITCLQEINAKPTPEIGPFEETQALVDTQTYEPQANSTPKAKEGGPLPPSNMAMTLDSPISTAPSTPSPIVPARMRRRSTRLRYDEDEEMLDTATQSAPDDTPHITGSVQSFPLDEKLESVVDRPDSSKTKAPVKDLGLQCNCGINDTEAQMLFCEAGCGRWYHVWCMGYHSIEDARLPIEYTCLDCRLRAEPGFEYLQDDFYPMTMEKYRDLATMRRAVKIFEHSDTLTQSELTKVLDNDSNMVRHYIKRMEEEGFIHQVATTIDGLGFETETRVIRKAKDRKAKQQKKNVQKIRYTFNKACKRGKEYKTYFNPEAEVESRLLGLDDLRNFRTSATGLTAVLAKAATPYADIPDTYEQTIEATLEQMDTGGRKRLAGGPIDENMNRPLKKVKISVATGIDLAE